MGLTLGLVCLFGLALGFALREALEKLGSASQFDRYLRHVKVRYVLKPKPRRLSLLGLPVEWRNIIYHQVLVWDEHVAITSANHAQPALLQTCTEIREEASAIYYRDNPFRLNAVNLDFGASIAFYQHASHWAPVLRLMGKGVSVTMSGQTPSWSKLLQGLKAAHEGRIPRIWHYPEPNAYASAASGAFEMVGELKGTPWEKVEGLLEVYNKVIVDSGGGTCSGNESGRGALSSSKTCKARH